MTTKRIEECPECKTPTEPTDAWTPWEDWFGTFRVRQWYYKCVNTECNWTWANEVQRANNSRFYNQALQIRRDLIY